MEENMEKGVVVALITPLNQDEGIDACSLDGLIEWVLSGGVNGIFLGGTIGEGPALRDSVRRMLFTEAVRRVRGRVPVLANVSDTGTLRAVDQARAAAEAGVDVLVVTARFGYPQRNRDETIRHVEAVASCASVPVWFYENPQTTHVTSTFETIHEVVSLHNVTGLKFSSPDRELFTRCVREFPAMPVMNGNVSEIAYSGSIGAWGVVSGMGSLFPGLCARTFRAAAEGRTDEAARLQAAISDAYAIYGGKDWPLWPAAQKHALMRRGVIRTAVVTAPFKPLTAEDADMVDRVMAQKDPDLFAPA
jgi:4-hydroxy-tetrahydrodipicolinate synthase